MKRTRIVVIAALALLVVGGFILGVAIYDRQGRESARAERVMQINEVVCNNYRTLHRLITGTPTTRREVLSALGFSEAQIDNLNVEQARTRKTQLELLGPRPENCE